MVLIGRAEPVAVVAVAPAAETGRSAFVMKCTVLFGRAGGVPPTAGADAARVTPGDMDAAAGMLPPLRSSDLGRPLGAVCAPVDAGKCGRVTDIVRLLPSNRSPRAPCAAGALASRMAMGWICVCVAASTRPTGIPLLMTRLLWPTIVADATVLLYTWAAC
jgi:hypothetical protein